MYENEFSFPQWLASQKYRTITVTATDSDGAVTTLTDGRKVIKSGAVWPANGATALGIAFNQVDVSNGDVALALLVEGYVYGSRLPVTVDNAVNLPEVKFVEYNATEV